MKGRYGVVICFIIICVSWTTVFVYGQSREFNSMAEKSIDGRCKCLKEFYNGEKNCTEVCKSLKRVETGLLLRKDKMYMNKYRDTDIDRLTDWNIHILKVKIVNNSKVKISAKISYTLKNLEETYKVCADEIYYGHIFKNRIVLCSKYKKLV